MTDPTLFDPADHHWTVTLEHNGHPIAVQLPIDDYDLATLVAPYMTALTSAPVSVALAVHIHRTQAA